MWQKHPTSCQLRGKKRHVEGTTYVARSLVSRPLVALAQHLLLPFHNGLSGKMDDWSGALVVYRLLTTAFTQLLYVWLCRIYLLIVRSPWQIWKTSYFPTNRCFLAAFNNCKLHDVVAHWGKKDSYWCWRQSALFFYYCFVSWMKSAVNFNCK